MSFLFTGGNRNKQMMSILVWRLKIVYPVKKYYYSRKYTHEKMKDVFFNWYWYNTISYFFSTCCCLFCVLTKQLAVLLNPLYPHRRQHRKATKKKSQLLTLTYASWTPYIVLCSIHCHRLCFLEIIWRSFWLPSPSQSPLMFLCPRHHYCVSVGEWHRYSCTIYEFQLTAKLELRCTKRMEFRRKLRHIQQLSNYWKVLI